MSLDRTFGPRLLQSGKSGLKPKFPLGERLREITSSLFGQSMHSDLSELAQRKLSQKVKSHNMT